MYINFKSIKITFPHRILAHCNVSHTVCHIFENIPSEYRKCLTIHLSQTTKLLCHSWERVPWMRSVYLFWVSGLKMFSCFINCIFVFTWHDPCHIHSFIARMQILIFLNVKITKRTQVQNDHRFVQCQHKIHDL